MRQNWPTTLEDYLTEVKKGKRRFENVFQIITRMILEGGIEKVKVRGKTTYDYKIFRQGKKHLIGLHDEINSFVNYVKDAAEGGSSREMAFVLVGEPGNGKTFFVDYLCELYRNYLSEPGNEKFTFRFKIPEELSEKLYGGIESIESQTFEDPMVLAMNLFESRREVENYLSDFGFSDKQLESFFENYRHLGACTHYILNDIRNALGGDFKELLKHIEIVPVFVSESSGTITGKYSAKDKITSSAVDLVGQEGLQRLMQLKDTKNPYRFDLQRGALARVAGGGIHFSDEIFRNKKDLVQIYLGVIQNRKIEIDGNNWPLDTLIIGTSNNEVYNDFLNEEREAPIVDRCRITYVGHNTDYKLQQKLTKYAIGAKKKTTINQEDLHEDPNLVYAASVAVVLSRLPRSKLLGPIEMMKLAAGEIAGEKSVKALVEVINELNYETDVTKRFGQKGIGQRNLGRAIQRLIETSETNEGKCMYAEDIFKALESVVLDYVPNDKDRKKYLEDIKLAKTLYKERIRTEIYNAYMDDPGAIKKDVMNYVNMIIGIDSDDLGPDNLWKYRDPQNNELKAIKIDEKFIDSVEERLGLKTKEQKDTFRTGIRKIYGQKIATDPEYDFMDNLELRKAVTEVKLNSDIHGEGSLIGALANRTNEENQQLHSRMMKTMMDKLGYCPTCAQRTLEYYCTHEDES